MAIETLKFFLEKKWTALQAEEEKGPWPTPPEAYLPIQWSSLFKTHIASSNSKRPHVFRIALIFRIFKIYFYFNIKKKMKYRTRENIYLF